MGQQQMGEQRMVQRRMAHETSVQPQAVRAAGVRAWCTRRASARQQQTGRAWQTGVGSSCRALHHWCKFIGEVLPMQCQHHRRRQRRSHSTKTRRRKMWVRARKRGREACAMHSSGARRSLHRMAGRLIDIPLARAARCRRLKWVAATQVGRYTNGRNTARINHHRLHVTVPCPTVVVRQRRPHSYG